MSYLKLLARQVSFSDRLHSPSAPPAFVPGENALLALGNSDTSTTQTPTDLSVGVHTGGLPFASTSILPARPNLPDDPLIPHNGFQTFEEGEKAFMHLLRKAGVDAGWTWDQTMRAIITDPLYKALSTLAEKKAAWQKVCNPLRYRGDGIVDCLVVHGCAESKGEGRERGEVVETSACT